MSLQETIFHLKERKNILLNTKDIILPHKFYADFVVYDYIILEVKAVKDIIDVHIAQTLNYIRLINGRLGIIANFNSRSLEHKRIIR